MSRNKHEKRARNIKCTERRRALIEYKGGKCMDCKGTFVSALLDFHHRDPRNKSFGLSFNRMERPIQELKKEADKCDLLCANCHRLRHWKEDRQ